MLIIYRQLLAGMRVVAIVQARMGSTRLPGKVMLPLAGDHVLAHVIRRVNEATTVDKIVVATSTEQQDDIIQQYVSRANATGFRGSESDVLGRMYDAAINSDADIIIRVTADCPLISPEIIDVVVTRLEKTSADYVSTKLDRTFPRAIGAAAFTIDSFELVECRSERAYEREHVTPYYHEQQGEFEITNVRSDELFDEERYINRTDLRLTLDEANDYELLRRIYEGVAFDNILEMREAIDYIDENGFGKVNDSVDQITLEDAKSESG